MAKAKKVAKKKPVAKKEAAFEVVKVRDILDDIEEQMEEVEMDVLKWDKDKNRVAGTRLRKVFEGVRKQLKALRKNIQTKKNLDKAEKVVAKEG